MISRRSIRSPHLQRAGRARGLRGALVLLVTTLAAARGSAASAAPAPQDGAAQDEQAQGDSLLPPELDVFQGEPKPAEPRPASEVPS